MSSDLPQRLIEHLPRLRRYAMVLTTRPDRADDLVQETFARALAKLHLWQPDTDLRAWLFRLMHNQYVNFVRWSARHGSHCSLDAAADLGKPATQIDQLLLRDFKRALDHLPDEQRAVVLMIGLEGMSYEEVADILSIPIGTVRSRLSRARETMRACMDAPELRKTWPLRERQSAPVRRSSREASAGGVSP